MFSSSKANLILKILDIIAFLFLLLITALWAAWAAGEIFHEGWYEPYWQIVYYFIPFVLALGFSAIAIFFPLAGGIVIISGGISYLLFFLIRAAELNIELQTSFILLIAAIIISGLLFIFIYILKRKEGPPSYIWQEWRAFENHPVFKRTIKIIVITGICLLIILAVGMPKLIRNLGRIQLEHFNEVEVRGNGIEAVFAGDGPGWYYSNENPVVFEGKQYSGISWNEIALFGKEPIGFEGKQFGPEYDLSASSIYFATQKDFDRYNMFRYISYDGLSLTSSIQDYWKLPSADEYARLMMRNNDNSGGYFDLPKEKAYYDKTPDKEAPIWAPEEMVIYYWTATSANQKEAYDITYAGKIRKISKLTKQDYRGWRAIRTDKEESGLTRMLVESLVIDKASNTPVILLKQKDDDIYLPIWIGQTEALSIALQLAEEEYPRPLTHDLMVDMLDLLSAEVSSVEINSVEYNIYLAVIRIKASDGSELVIDSRPSDAIALALRVNCDIFASYEIINNYGIKFDTYEDRIQQFKQL